MSDQFSILSLDGGGIKGLYPAAILAHLEDDLKIRIQDHFDLIVGTSTGGIVALGLGLGLSPREIVNFYLENGKSIFPPGLWKKVKSPWRSKYNCANLETALKRSFADARLGDSVKRLVIPAFNLDKNIHLFKTSHHQKFTRDYKLPMWQVAMATSAAPTYFSVCNINGQRLLDGGVWANNPIMVGLIEAVHYLQQPVDRIRIFSLGTSEESCDRPDKLNKGGWWTWGRAALDVALCGQSFGATTHAELLIGKQNVLRINSIVPKDRFKLDKLSYDQLMGMADSDSRSNSPHFTRMFCSHTAPQFTPFHTEK